MPSASSLSLATLNPTRSVPICTVCPCSAAFTWRTWPDEAEDGLEGRNVIPRQVDVLSSARLAGVVSLHQVDSRLVAHVLHDQPEHLPILFAQLPHHDQVRDVVRVRAFLGASAAAGRQSLRSCRGRRNGTTAVTGRLMPVRGRAPEKGRRNKPPLLSNKKHFRHISDIKIQTSAFLILA